MGNSESSTIIGQPPDAPSQSPAAHGSQSERNGVLSISSLESLQPPVVSTQPPVVSTQPPVVSTRPLTDSEILGLEHLLKQGDLKNTLAEGSGKPHPTQFRAVVAPETRPLLLLPPISTGENGGRVTILNTIGLAILAAREVTSNPIDSVSTRKPSPTDVPERSSSRSGTHSVGRVVHAAPLDFGKGGGDGFDFGGDADAAAAFSLPIASAVAPAAAAAAAAAAPAAAPAAARRMRPSRARDVRRLAESQIGRRELWKNFRPLIHTAIMARLFTVLPSLLRPRIPCLDGGHDHSDSSSSGLLVRCQDCVASLCPGCDRIAHSTESTMLHHRSSSSGTDIHPGFFIRGAGNVLCELGILLQYTPFYPCLTCGAQHWTSTYPEHSALRQQTSAGVSHLVDSNNSRVATLVGHTERGQVLLVLPQTVACAGCGARPLSVDGTPLRSIASAPAINFLNLRQWWPLSPVKIGAVMHVSMLTWMQKTQETKTSTGVSALNSIITSVGVQNAGDGDAEHELATAVRQDSLSDAYNEHLKAVHGQRLERGDTITECSRCGPYPTLLNLDGCRKVRRNASASGAAAEDAYHNQVFIPPSIAAAHAACFPAPVTVNELRAGVPKHLRGCVNFRAGDVRVAKETGLDETGVFGLCCCHTVCMAVDAMYEPENSIHTSTMASHVAMSLRCRYLAGDAVCVAWANFWARHSAFAKRAVDGLAEPGGGSGVSQRSASRLMYFTFFCVVYYCYLLIAFRICAFSVHVADPPEPPASMAAASASASESMSVELPSLLPVRSLSPSSVSAPGSALSPLESEGSPSLSATSPPRYAPSSLAHPERLDLEPASAPALNSGLALLSVARE